jgi:hypothetical protein
MNHVENRMDPLCTKVGGARVSMAELARAVALHRSTLSSQIRSTRIGLCSLRSTCKIRDLAPLKVDSQLAYPGQ